jgi:hypothetical protein
MSKKRIFSEEDKIAITESLIESLKTAPGDRVRRVTIPSPAVDDAEGLICEIIDAYNSGHDPYKKIEKAKAGFISDLNERRVMGKASAGVIAGIIADDIQEAARGR